MRTVILATVTGVLLAASQAAAQSAPALQRTAAADSAAVRQAALDYIEGWYEADAARMARAVHPELAKRWVRTDSTGASMIRDMGASELIAQTRRGGGERHPGCLPAA